MEPTPPVFVTPGAAAGERLRRLFEAAADTGAAVAMPGAFNPLVARAIARAGFSACYVSGAATTFASGVPDIGLRDLAYFTALIRDVCDAARVDAPASEPARLPVLADADTGFGEAEMARRAVIEYARAGAAGLHIEDQVFPKRCGHLDGKKLVPMDHAIEKLQWACKAARDVSATASAPGSPRAAGAAAGFVVCARTDARGVDGFEAAVDRAAAYVRAGADMIFPEGLASADEFSRFARAMRDVPTGGRTLDPRGGPYLLANMTEFGKTPMIPLAEFGKMGYAAVIWPVTLMRVAMGAVTRALATLRETGSPEPLLAQMQTRKELYDLIGYDPMTPWEYPVG